MEPFLWRWVVPCFVGSSVVWPLSSLLRVHPIVVLSLPSALISFSHPHNRFNEDPASYWCSTFPWRGFHGNGKNNADPQHCCSLPANSSLKGASKETTSATGFRGKIWPLSSSHYITDHDYDNYLLIICCCNTVKKHGMRCCAVLPGDMLS